MVNFVSTPQYQSLLTRPKKQGTGFSYSSAAPTIVPGSQPTFGQNFIASLNNRSAEAQTNYTQRKQQNNAPLASTIVQKSAGTVPLDQYLKPQQTLTDFSDIFNQQLQSTRDKGQFATQTAEARRQWSDAKKAQDLAAGFTIQTPAGSYAPKDLPAGASKDNKGAQAVAIAMNVVKNNTPYVWGGNSLKSGVDCSGLVQQLYRQLGVNIPRTTYEQAKSGKVVSRNQLLPGDLIFYNTGSSDPNGIGRNSHVAIYMGNGKVIEAAHTGTNVRISNMDSPGQYSMAVRPW